MSPIARQIAVLVLAGLTFGMTAAARQGVPPRPAAPVPPVAPVRDPLVVPTGPGTLTGIVLDDADGRPIRRALINLTGAPLRGGKEAVTDEAGRFAVTSLPFGQYLLSVRKSPFVTTYYGSRRPGRGPGQPIGLTAAQQAIDVVLRMPRGAVITGVVRDANGRPAQNVRMTLMEHRMVIGERQLQTASISGSMQTDDRGVYRLWGLTAGEYIVGAVPQNTDVHLVTSAEIQKAQQQVQQQGRGRIGPTPVAVPGASTSASAVSRPSTPSADSGGSVGYSRIFYPGTPQVTGAATVALRSGEERAGVDFSLDYVPVARIEGTIVDVSGQPVANPQISVFQPGIPAGMAGWMLGRGPEPGRFTVSGLAPGQYIISARTSGVRGGRAGARLATPPPPGGPGSGTGRGGPGSGTGGGFGPMTAPPDVSWAETEIGVNGQTVSGVTLTLQPGLTGAGRVAFHSAGSEVPTALSGLRVQLLPSGNQAGGMGVQPVLAQMDPDGSFTFSGIVPGRYRFSGSNPPPASPGAARGDANGPAWIMESITVNGRDVTDRTMDIGAGDSLHDIVITFFDRAASISGKLLDATGQPARGLTVILFTADRTFWGLQSRRTVQMPSPPTGDFRFFGLLPGDYHIAAVNDFDPSDTADPTFFESLVGASIKVTVGPGEAKVQNLQLAPK